MSLKSKIIIKLCSYHKGKTRKETFKLRSKVASSRVFVNCNRDFFNYTFLVIFIKKIIVLVFKFASIFF